MRSALVTMLLIAACDAAPTHLRTSLEHAATTVVASAEVTTPDVSDAGTDATADATTDTTTDTRVGADSITTDSTVSDSVAPVDAPQDSVSEVGTFSDAGSDSGSDAGSDASSDAGSACHIGAIDGVCRHVSECGSGEAAIEGVCEGSPQIRCCLPSLDRCSVAGVTGACLAVSDCPAPTWQPTSGKCPGAASIQCCSDPTATNPCDPDARPTPNAGLVVEAPGDAGCPPGMIMSAGFCIDRYEASLVLVSDATQTFSPYVNPDVPVRAVSIAWTVPQGHISGTEARAACVAAGKRLCTSDEWLRACQGSADNTYPYGSVRTPGVCNDDRGEHVAYEYFQTTASWVFSELDHPCLSQLPNSLDLAGENDGCVSEDGAYDMMGNLHEWVDDAAGTFRGGFFDDTSINGQGCLYRTTAHDIGHWDYSTGFRCCADPL